MEQLLSAETKSFSSIFSENKKIIVPPYQRAYSWREQQWEDLWEDIKKSKKSNRKHYMGALVFINRRGGTLEVVDGQQRLTTISILINSVVKYITELISKNIDVEKNIERRNLIRNLIGRKSAVDLTWENILQLNNENNDFYVTYIMNPEFASKIPTKVISTNKLLLQCQDYFYKKIQEYCRDENKLEQIIELAYYVAENMIFVKMVATDDLSAYTIFETLNDRGLDLSVTDLLKNYLLSLFKYPNDQKFAKSRWDEIISKVELKNFPMFLRYYWMIYNKAVKKDELFKEIKNKIKNKKDALKFLDLLSEYADIFNALEDESNEFWVGKDKLQRYMKSLHILKVKQCYPLLMVAMKEFEEKKYEKIFKMCEIVSFRYLTICSRNPNALEDVYNRTCLKITNNTEISIEEVKKSLSSIYVKDQEFIDSFKIKVLNTKSNKKIVKYILIKIEEYIDNNFLYNIEDPKLTIEHILPENPNKEWKEKFKKQEIEECTYRIGNYTLMKDKDNRNVGNEQYKVKKEIYAKSNIHLTNSIPKYYEEWNFESLDMRQNELAKKAAEIWRI